MRSIRQQSHSTESFNRTITFSASGQATSSGSNVRSASASGQADSFSDSEWEDHWWSGPETWASGGTYQNGTYDDYNYQYQWTKTWVPEGEPEVSESATNVVAGVENGAGTGWWSWSSAGGSSSSTSWSGSWSECYDTAVEYPGFYDGAYYEIDYGGGREAYFEYLGDAFGDGLPGTSGGMFPFAYSEEELLFAMGWGGAQQDNRPRAANVAFSAAGRVYSEATNGDCLLPTAPAPAGIDGSTSFSQATDASDDQTTQENLLRTGGGTDASGESVVVATAGTSGRGGGGGYWDWVQGSLDVAGCVPLLGEVPDGANLVISLFRRDWTGAGLSALSMIPAWGDAIGKGGKIARYAAKYGDEAAAAVRGVTKASDLRFATKYGQYVHRADNFKHVLSKEHVLAALAEKQGKTVKLRPDGTPFDHLKETRNAMHGAKLRIKDLEKYLGDPNLTPEQRAVIQGELSELSRMLDWAERILGEFAP